MKTEAETKVLYKLRNAKGHWLSPEARREAWNKFLLRALQRNQPCWHLDFGPLASKTVKECISVVSRHPVCGIYFAAPLGNSHTLCELMALNILLFQCHQHAECMWALPTLFSVQNLTHTFPSPTPLPGKFKTWSQCLILAKPFLLLLFASGSWCMDPHCPIVRWPSYPGSQWPTLPQYTLRFLRPAIPSYPFLYTQCQVPVRTHCLLSNGILINISYRTHMTQWTYSGMILEVGRPGLVYNPGSTTYQLLGKLGQIR